MAGSGSRFTHQRPSGAAMGDFFWPANSPVIAAPAASAKRVRTRAETTRRFVEEVAAHRGLSG